MHTQLQCCPSTSHKSLSSHLKIWRLLPFELWPLKKPISSQWFGPSLRRTKLKASNLLVSGSCSTATSMAASFTTRAFCRATAARPLLTGRSWRATRRQGSLCSGRTMDWTPDRFYCNERRTLSRTILSTRSVSFRVFGSWETFFRESGLFGLRERLLEVYLYEAYSKREDVVTSLCELRGSRGLPMQGSCRFLILKFFLFCSYEPGSNGLAARGVRQTGRPALWFQG